MKTVIKKYKYKVGIITEANKIGWLKDITETARGYAFNITLKIQEADAITSIEAAGVISTLRSASKDANIILSESSMLIRWRDE